MTRPPLPPLAAVAAEQVRAVCLALRPLAVVLGPLAVLVTLVAWGRALYEGRGLAVTPGVAPLVALAALPLPALVWRDEFQSRRPYLATLPVGRTRHTLLKATAGWAWLMVVVGAFVGWLLVGALVTGGSVGVGATGGPGAPAWAWGVPFTAATLAYAVGTVAVLAGGRTRLWLAGIAGVVFFLLVFSDEAVSPSWTAEVAPLLLEGRFGLETVLTGSPVWAAEHGARPGFSRWSAATVLWVGSALAAVVGVAGRDRRS